MLIIHSFIIVFSDSYQSYCGTVFKAHKSCQRSTNNRTKKFPIHAEKFVLIIHVLFNNLIIT